MGKSKKMDWKVPRPFHVLLPCLLFIVITMSSAPSRGSWTEWRGDPLHSAFEDGPPPEEGELIWSYLTGDQVLSSPVFHDEGLLIGSDDGNLYCLDPELGELLWKYKTGSSIQATPLVMNGRAYFGSFDRNLYCISLPQSGTGGAGLLEWNVSLHGQVLSSCHWYEGSVVTADNMGYLYRIDEEGEMIWEKHLSDLDFWASPLIIDDAGMAIIGNIGKELWLIDLSGGDILWKKTFLSGAEFYSSGTYLDGIFYISGGIDEMFYAIRVSDGEIVWSFDIGHPSYSTPVISGGRIYFGSYEMMWCIPLEDPSGDSNISQDEVIWSSSIHDYQGGSSPLVTVDRAYIGSDDWHLYCFDSATGEEIWAFETKGYVYSSPSLHEEKVYFGSSDRNIYCIGKRPPGLVIDAEPGMREITSDNITEIFLTITDDLGQPAGDVEVTFRPSAGFIAFDTEGNTRLSHHTDTSGDLIVYYFPVQVSSRSTMDIIVNAQKEGLRPASFQLQIIVEPGQSGTSPGSDVGKDVMKRAPYMVAVGSMLVLNIVLLLLVIIWSLRNRNEEREVGS
ncbi:MAG: PQQ-binding-like beta-propeller repeat protein [Candidatus Thermoplasmatota archaeon]|nr:PQQ-binding-like beta-propeller repeat protein [Candidatus Thermoplasmatota archaeon]